MDKKTIHAPFAGRLGISPVNRGQYLNPGDKIVTLQSLDSIYVDFYLPQQELSRVSPGQTVVAFTDAYPGRTFSGKISAVNPKVDPQTRNVQIEATLQNPRHELLPGMYASVEVRAGAVQRYEVYALDVTGRKRMEEELRNELKQKHYHTDLRMPAPEK